MNTRIVIPTADWHIALPRAIKEAPQGATIVVDTAAKLELARSAAAPGRLDRSDLRFVLEVIFDG